ncbi:MAG: HIT family hydrolase [Thermoprotei archaeon]|nr:MAG: HIT family hydrolase [Thermoprotei archaeon]
MRVLWAPWRMRYIRHVVIEKEEGCIFCNALKSKRDREKLVLYRGKTAFIMLNLYPYNNGHILIAPKRHVDSLEKLDDGELLEIMRLIKKMIVILRKEYSPDGFNIGLNVGRIAGAGVEDHIHIHIIPRWNGDTSFMPIISNTKVIPEAIYETYDRLKKYL